MEEIARVAGHKVVHSRPYHCEMNSIELNWSQVQKYNKGNNWLFTLLAEKGL